MATNQDLTKSHKTRFKNCKGSIFGMKSDIKNQDQFVYWCPVKKTWMTKKEYVGISLDSDIRGLERFSNKDIPEFYSMKQFTLLDLIKQNNAENLSKEVWVGVSKGRNEQMLLIHQNDTHWKIITETGEFSGIVPKDFITKNSLKPYVGSLTQ